MIEEARELIKKLNSPSDWAIVGGAAVVGAAVDGAINLIPLPFFSPGVCSLLAAGSALSCKRGVEAHFELRVAAKRRQKLMAEGGRCLSKLRAMGLTDETDDAAWELDIASENLNALEAVVRALRDDLKAKTSPVTAQLGTARSPLYVGPPAADLIAPETSPDWLR